MPSALTRLVYLCSNRLHNARATKFIVHIELKSQIELAPITTLRKQSNMPRVTDVTASDSDADRPRAKQKEYSSKKNRVSSSEQDLASEDEEAPEEDGDEQDEEYEIEDVIESNKGYFGDVRSALCFNGRDVDAS